MYLFGVSIFFEEYAKKTIGQISPSDIKITKSRLVKTKRSKNPENPPSFDNMEVKITFA